MKFETVDVQKLNGLTYEFVWGWEKEMQDLDQSQYHASCHAIYLS